MSKLCYLLVLLIIQVWAADPPTLDNGISELPEVDCMEDRVKLSFKTQRPFHGRIFVKGMVDKQACVRDFVTSQAKDVTFELENGACNMRRQRMLGPEKRGMEMSMTVIISFHSTFITKVDRAYRCTCFYMEADKVVTNKFDVSMLPTTDLIDTARMPLCTYSVRRDSITGPIVEFAKVGETVYHVWNCESDMFSMLVHSCFVDDGNGDERKPLLDEHGCAIDPLILPDLTYNKDNNVAYAQVNTFKFADKVSTYFQCAVSTCMNTEGMCDGKTPPRCGPAGSFRSSSSSNDNGFNRRSRRATLSNRTAVNWVHLADTMDLAANKITVFELEEKQNSEDKDEPPAHSHLAILQGSHPSTVVCLNQSRIQIFFVLSFLMLTVVTVLTIFTVRRSMTAPTKCQLNA
ncbi:ZP domain-containing protein [Caenorhabditis elegans]|uniref:ZP domain-containing protein n=1 Tax=Caenorhabditis elegans TaxID=6239 RepID=Q9U250_CAEEL|nr:ZP domain-containing protein [Caenorhabditis elegans]CAB60411.1 ZP domain-containing protein [Caenorhabditis elegans]|eukprot:NP_492900.1 CUTiclin-Like [Caenorhabditis elegans]